MKFCRIAIMIMVLVTVFAYSAVAQEPIHWDVIQKIRVEGFYNSRVMEIASYMTDVFGPRLSHSPSYRAAAEWAQKKFEEYGLANVQLEPYGEFGVSWRNDYTSVHMMTPQYMPIIAYPNTWSSGTNGRIQGQVVYIDVEEIVSEADLAQYRGTLKNAIVFIQPKQELFPEFSPMAVRYSKEWLDEYSQTVIPLPDWRQRRDQQAGRLPRNQIIDFLFSEGAAAIAAPGGNIINSDGRENYGNFGTVRVNGGRKTWENISSIHPPFLVMAGEHYNRIMRVLEKGIPVEMEMDLRISITEDDPTDHNVIAEIPGTDLADEVVLFGGHLDATSAGTGASDNAAGAAVAMEAIRILRAIGVTPRRTIRVALWGGEEVGLLGSRGYVAKHYGNPDTQQYTPEHEKFAAYFNKDRDTGRIRGVNLQGNERLRPIFTEWIKPFHNLGMTHLSSRSSWNSDHASFNAVGLPAVQFIQDPIEDRAAHTNMDVYDRLVPEDLMQSAVIIASFAYHAAMRDEKLPRVAPSSERE